MRIWDLACESVLEKVEGNAMTETEYKVDEADIRAYQRDGAIVLRGVLSGQWISRMQVAIDNLMNNPMDTAVEFTPEGKEGRYFGDMFVWLRDPDFRALFLESPLGRLAADLMQSSEARVLYDQLLVKEPNTEEITPWHQDLPYWPVQGEQIISFWCGFDPVSLDSGGVVYLRGSHRWNKFYAPDTFGANEKTDAIFEEVFNVNLEKVPDIDSHLDDYELLSWDMQPGDVLVHHPLTLHSSSGNFSTDIRRRGLALRYIGDDASYDDREGTFAGIPDLSAALGLGNYKRGDKLGGDCFPRAWPPEL